jgi:hypothetical protein
MAGRAGRRGFDDAGFVVAVQTMYEGADQCLSILQRPPESLTSQFTPSYGMAVNMLRRCRPAPPAASACVASPSVWQAGSGVVHRVGYAHARYPKGLRAACLVKGEFQRGGCLGRCCRMEVYMRW